jgi:hypothetical protein
MLELGRTSNVKCIYNECYVIYVMPLPLCCRRKSPSTVNLKKCLGMSQRTDAGVMYRR